MNNFNWQWWQFFLCIVEFGSINKAAAALNISQPTLSRHLFAMEKKLGQSLFDRSTQGLTLTSFAAGLLEEGKVMQASAMRLQRIAHGQGLQLKGRVRLSVNEMIAQYYLPELLPQFMQRYPDISVEIEVSNKASNIDKRDADIAIRMFHPTQQDLIARKLVDLPLGFFASGEYLQQHGIPENPQQIFEHRLLGYDRDQQLVEGGSMLGIDISNEQFLFRCDFMPLQFELALKGAGIVITHQKLAIEKGLTEIATEINLPSLPTYIVCHRDVQHNPRIRAMMDFLSDSLAQLLTQRSR